MPTTDGRNPSWARQGTAHRHHPGATSARAGAGNRTPLIAQSDCRGLFRSAVCRAVRPSNPEPTLGSAIGPTEAGPGAFGLPVTSPKIHHLMRSVKGPCTQSRWFRRTDIALHDGARPALRKTAGSTAAAGAGGPTVAGPLGPDDDPGRRRSVASEVFVPPTPRGATAQWRQWRAFPFSGGERDAAGKGGRRPLPKAVGTALPWGLTATSGVRSP